MRSRSLRLFVDSRRSEARTILSSESRTRTAAEIHTEVAALLFRDGVSDHAARVGGDKRATSALGEPEDEERRVVPGPLLRGPPRYPLQDRRCLPRPSPNPHRLGPPSPAGTSSARSARTSSAGSSARAGPPPLPSRRV